MRTMSMIRMAREIAQLLLLHQQQMDVETAALPLVLENLSSHILTELQAHPHTFTELAQIIGIERSKLSRTIKALEEKRLLEKISTSDKRAFSLRISSKGRSALQADDAKIREMLERMLDALSREEQSRLIELLHFLADTLGVPAHPEGDAHPFHKVLRRLSRFAGIVNERFFEEQLSPAEYRLLTMFRRSAQPSGIKDAGTQLDLHQSTVSRMCARLERLGFLQRPRSRVDKRAKPPTITHKGLLAFDRIERKITGTLTVVLRRFSAEEPQELIKLLRTYLRLVSESSSPLEGLLIKKLSTEAARNAARQLALQEFMQQPKTESQSLPALLFAPEQYNFGIYDMDKLVAAASFDSQTPCDDAYLVVSNGKVKESTLNGLVKKCAQMVKGK